MFCQFVFESNKCVRRTFVKCAFSRVCRLLWSDWKWCQINATQKSNAIFFTLKVFVRDAIQFREDFCLIFLTHFRDHITFCFLEPILATPNARYTSGYRSSLVNGPPNIHRHWNATEKRPQQILWKIVKTRERATTIILCVLRSILFLLSLAFRLRSPPFGWHSSLPRHVCFSPFPQ